MGCCSIDLGIQFNHQISHINHSGIRSRSVVKCLPLKNRRRISCCSAVDEQQKISFSDAESSLISSLIGIQGRGRSASPQQLKVSFC